MARVGILRTYPGLAAAGAAAYAMSTLFSAMKPILLTRYVEQLDLDVGVAGAVVALPFVGIAISSVLMRGYLLRAPYRAVASVFGLILVMTEALSAYVFQQIWLVSGLQFLSGICVGVLMGTTSRYVATSEAPNRLFGFVDMTAVLLMSFMVFLVGLAVSQAGLAGGYFSAAGIALVFWVCLFAFNPPKPSVGEDRVAAAPGLDFSVRALAVVLMGVLFITFSGIGFAFMFTMAADLGMDYDVAGTQIGILLFVSAFACQVGGWAGERFGPERPLAIAFVVCGLGWYAAVYAPAPALYLAALVPAIFSLQFCFPILLAFCASLDDRGQWSAVASPLITSGFAWAAIVAGQVVGAMGVAAIAGATAVGMGCCLALLALATNHTKQNHTVVKGEGNHE